MDRNLLLRQAERTLSWTYALWCAASYEHPDHERIVRANLRAQARVRRRTRAVPWAER
jgi:hypothetical protein